jgi:hypothetical protein
MIEANKFGEKNFGNIDVFLLTVWNELLFSKAMVGI